MQTSHCRSDYLLIYLLCMYACVYRQTLLPTADRSHPHILERRLPISPLWLLVHDTHGKYGSFDSEVQRFAIGSWVEHLSLPPKVPRSSIKSIKGTSVIAHGGDKAEMLQWYQGHIPDVVPFCRETIRFIRGVSIGQGQGASLEQGSV